MNNILEQLYNGEIYPTENIVPTNPQYRPLTRKISDEREALQTKLNAEDSERLEALGEMYVETSSMYGYENFLCGFKLGASLMLEILKGGEGQEV